MERRESPSFQFYPKDFLGDGNVRAMTIEEVGAYWILVSICWGERSLPLDLGKLARMLHISIEKMTELWPALEPCFVVEPDGKGGSRLVHKRLDLERKKQEAWRRKSQVGGRNSAAKRAADNTQVVAEIEVKTPISGSRVVEPQVNLPVEPKGNSSVFCLQTTVKEEKSTPPPPSRGRDRFERFWAVYPSKVGKDAAWKVWQQRNPDDAMTDRILAAVEQQRQSAKWRKDGGEFIPNPRTWLNQGRWQDEPCDIRAGPTDGLSKSTLAVIEATRGFLSDGEHLQTTDTTAVCADVPDAPRRLPREAGRGSPSG